MKVVVLGSEGMLGHMVAEYLSPHFEIVPFNRRFELHSKENYISEISRLMPDVVINCVGMIHQKCVNLADFYLVNAVLPFELANGLSEKILILHPSTDCVFDGSSVGAYPKCAVPNAVDDYGCSKALGENVLGGLDNSIVIRVSVIGPELRNGSNGLLAWFLAQPPNSTVNGFTNHFWNGITTIEWCSIVKNILLDDLSVPTRGGILQLGTELKISKYDLLLMFKRIFRPDIEVTPVETDRTINRCLVSDIAVKPIIVQLEELVPVCRLLNLV